MWEGTQWTHHYLTINVSILGQKSHYQVNDAQFYMALLAAILRAARRVAEKPLVWNHKEQGEQSWRSADDVMKTLAYVGKVLFERGSTNPQGVEWKQMCETLEEKWKAQVFFKSPGNGQQAYISGGIRWGATMRINLPWLGSMEQGTRQHLSLLHNPHFQMLRERQQRGNHVSPQHTT